MFNSKRHRTEFIHAILRKFQYSLSYTSVLKLLKIMCITFHRLLLHRNNVPFISFNALNAKLNPICHFLALIGAHNILHVSRIRVNQNIGWNLKLYLVCIVVSCLVCTVVVVFCVLLSSHVYLLYYVCIAVFTLDAGMLTRSQYSEGPATGHLDSGFSWFPVSVS